jgi:hypothetical protein
MVLGDDYQDHDDETTHERATTPCPIDEGAHHALLDELELGLAVARRSMARTRIFGDDD